MKMKNFLKPKLHHFKKILLNLYFILFYLFIYFFNAESTKMGNESLTE